ncbi:MAG TPA: hypothetical protein VJK51_01960 [Candidatus Nanoarchaeia archaeon]|nr:hypothetical protein [Candidatus Nanoarchaeia archaeon]
MGKSRLLYKKCYNKSNRERFPQTEKECLLVETNEYRAVLHAWKRGYNALGFEEYKESGRIMIKSKPINSSFQTNNYYSIDFWIKRIRGTKDLNREI